MTIVRYIHQFGSLFLSASGGVMISLPNRHFQTKFHRKARSAARWTVIRIVRWEDPSDFRSIRRNYCVQFFDNVRHISSAEHQKIE